MSLQSTMRYIVACGIGAAAALQNAQGVRTLSDGDTLVLRPYDDLGMTP